MTFAEVARPYLEKFGPPDFCNEIALEDKIFVQYHWEEVDVMVEFDCPKDNKKTGWELSFAVSFNPLKYYKDYQKDNYLK